MYQQSSALYAPTILFLQAMRQLDLWLKYSFTCQCKRCSAMPLTYVDHALQEIYALNLHSSNQSFLQNEGNEKLTDFIDDAISEYQTYGDAESCCEKLETVLTDGLLLDEQSETSEEICRLKIMLHPLHLLSLNAYTALASAYKVRASDLLAKNPKTAENCLYAFRMNRISAAYALLLASLSHHLFLSESSLVASVANFWTGAGESLLNLSRSSMWNMFAKCQFSVSELPSFHGYKCSQCTLLDNFEATFASSHTHNSEFEDITRKFLDCITSIMPEVWSFLVQDNSYLGMVTDPIDLRWCGAMCVSAIFLDCKGCLGSRDTKLMNSRCKEEQAAQQERTSIFHLSVHCLLYGWFLSEICGGKDSYSVCYVRGLLYVEGT